MKEDDYLRLIENAPAFKKEDARTLRDMLTHPVFLSATKDAFQRVELARDQLTKINPFTEEGRLQIALKQAEVRAYYGVLISLLALANPSEEENPNA